MFALDKDKRYKDLDRCIDASRENDLCSIANLTRGQQPPKKRAKHILTKPAVMVKFNSGLGKAKPIICTALLDSGGAESIATESLVKKLRVRKSKGPPQI